MTDLFAGSIGTVVTSPAAKQAWRTRRRILFKRTLSPPPKLQLDEWADAKRYLSRENSAEPGRWDTNRTPYLRAIMRAVTNPAVEEIVVMKAARVGYTEGILANAIGYYIDQDPSPILVVQPTVEDAEGWSKDSLTPLIEETPCLRGKVREQAAKKSGNTILSKRYPGGSVRAIGANSPRGFRRITVRIVIFDEVDGYVAGGAGSEGDQIKLGSKRALSFDNRKIILGSTPTLKGASRIEKAYDASSMGRLFCSCPHCGHAQVLTWKGIAWDKETLEDGTVRHLPETAHYVCESCACVIEEKDKRAMIVAACDAEDWRHEHPERPVLGFHISALYSLFHGARWEVLVREFLEAKDFPELLQVWTNTVLGETFEVTGNDIDPTSLAARCELYAAEVPIGAALLTAAVDTQDDRLEFKVKAWGPGQESWLIDTQTFWGDPGQPEVWEALDLAWRKRYRHEGGASLPIRVMCVDSGGHHTDAVYTFARPRQGRGVFAIAGSARPGRAIWPRSPSKANKYGVKLFQIGVDTAKDVIFSRLRRAVPGPTYMHYPDGTPDEYFAGLTSETKVRQVNRKNGQVRFMYVKTRPRNEPLDLEVYNLAGLHSLGRAVFDHLDRILKKVLAEGQKLRDAGLVPATATPPVRGTPAAIAVVPDSKPQASVSRAPRRRGFVNRWR